LSENSDLEGVISRMRRYLGIEIPLRLLTFSEDVIDGVPTFTAEPYVVDEPTAANFILTVRCPPGLPGIGDDIRMQLQTARIGFGLVSDVDRDSLQDDGAWQSPLDEIGAETEWVSPGQPVIDFEICPPADLEQDWVAIIDPITKWINGQQVPHRYRSVNGEPCRAHVWVQVGSTDVKTTDVQRVRASNTSRVRRTRSVVVDGMGGANFDSKYTLYGYFQRA